MYRMDAAKNEQASSERALEYVEMMRKGGQVKRFHTEHIIGEETVGHHTYGVITWVMALTERMASLDLILSALYHDTDEQLFGDLPGPSKWHNGDIDKLMEKYRNRFRDEHQLHIQLTDEEHLTLRWADKLDLLMTCRDQWLLGNSRGVVIGLRVVDRLQSMEPHPLGYAVLERFITEEPHFDPAQEGQ